MQNNMGKRRGGGWPLGKKIKNKEWRKKLKRGKKNGEKLHKKRGKGIKNASPQKK